MEMGGTPNTAQDELAQRPKDRDFDYTPELYRESDVSHENDSASKLAQGGGHQ